MKVTRKPANFSTSGEYNTAGVTIDEKLAQNYNSRIVNTAIELKAKYGSKYSDEYYLESAANWYKSELNTAFNSAYLKGTVGCPIQNPQWAGYSYEEIIKMENNGVKIPQDVLLWAHAQQESDITSYEVVTSTGENDDNSSTEELSGDFDINSLQKKAKENIAKSEKAQEDIQQTVEEYNQNKEKAIQLKNEKEKALKNSISEITKLTNEWKKLDQKAKNGTLSEAERSRYEELSKTLGNETNKNTSFDNNELDELLKSMNLLETKATADLVIADETVQSGRELSKYNKNYHQMQQTHILNNMILSGDSGLLSNTIFGSSSTYIQELAIRTGNDLSILSNAQLTELNTPETVDLKDFATAYTDINKNTDKENNNQSTQTTNQDENKVAPQSQNTQTTNTTNAPTTNETNNTNNLNKNTNKKEKEDKNTNYFVFPMSGTPAAALAATAVSAISTADLIGKQDKTNETKVKLQKDLAATEKNLQRLQKQINNVEKQHNDYIQTSETYLAQIDNLMAEQEAQSVQNNPQPKPIVLNQNQNNNNVNPQTENNDTTPEIEQQGEEQQQNPKFEQIQNISNELNTVTALDNALISSMKKPLAIGQNLINSNQKTTKTLNQQKNNLNEQNQNNQLVSVSTTYCGTLTTTMGAYNMSIAIPMLNTGLSMLASFNPVTVSMGQAMCAVAKQWIAIATAQLVTGPGALTAGTVGIVSSVEASKDIKEQGNIIKNSQKESDANNKTLRILNNNLNKLEPIQGVNAADFAPSQPAQQPAQQPQDTPKLATSKTRDISFETMKDVTKLPQGPTNLSNPLNDVKKENAQQRAKTTPTQTPKTEEKKPQEDVKTPTTPSNTNAKTNSTPVTSTPIVEVTDSTPATSSTPTTAETYSTPEAQAIPVNISTAQTQEPKTTPTSETTTTETETSTNSTQNTEEPAPVDETTTATTDETSTPETTSTEENDTPEEDEIIDTENIEKETELEIAVIENNTQSGEFTDDATLLGAAATTSANIKSNVTTDDKADRKLSRFNMDSIIESKKKKKKVQAVSASSKG